MMLARKNTVAKIAIWLAGMAAVGAGCSEERSNVGRTVDAGDDAASGALAQALVLQSSVTGEVSFGDGRSGALIIDGASQRPVGAARVEVLPQAGGFLVRTSSEEAGTEPDVTFISEGEKRVIEVEPRSAALYVRVVRAQVQVQDARWLAEGDAEVVAALAQSQEGTTILFAGTDAVSARSGRYHVYRSGLTNTLIAVDATSAARLPNGTVISGAARVLGTQGVRRARGRVVGEDVAFASSLSTAEASKAPSVSNLQVTPTADAGKVQLSWTSLDPAAVIVAFEAGIDTTHPRKRLPATAVGDVFEVAQGEHFACVRPVFAGNDRLGAVACTSFVATTGAMLPNVRVRVRAVEGPAAVTRKRVPVEVEVENVGQAPATAFDVALSVAENGDAESSGLGDLRSVHFDRVAPGGVAKRRAYVSASRDGEVYVVAKVDAAHSLTEANEHDNKGRAPLSVTRGSRSSAPVLSLGVPRRGKQAVVGDPIELVAFAHDGEDGNITSRIVWSSSIDGTIGQGGRLTVATLSPGRHRVTARVVDANVAAAAAPLSARKRDRDFSQLRGTPMPLAQAAADGTEVAAELEVVVRPAGATGSAPSLFAGPDVVASAGSVVALQATADDADGESLSVAWTALDPNGAPLPLMNANGAALTFTPTLPGTYRLKSAASDGQQSAVDDVDVFVLPAGENRPPLVSAAAPAAVAPSAAVNVKVEASDADDDGVTLSYLLTAPAGSQATLITSATQDVSFQADVAGDYQVVVRADDGRGGRAQAVANVKAADVPSDPAAANLVMRLQLDEAAGSVAADATANRNNGTVAAGTTSPAPPVPAPMWAPGKVGGSLALTGNGQHVRVPTSASIRPATGGSFTASAWIYLNGHASAGQRMIIAQQGEGRDIQNFALSLDNGVPTMAVHLFNVAAPAALPANQWVHLAWTYDGVAGTIYVNGMLSASSDFAWNLTSHETPLLIGASQNSAGIGRFFSGSLDDVRLYNRALNALEVAQLAR